MSAASFSLISVISESCFSLSSDDSDGWVGAPAFGSIRVIAEAKRAFSIASAVKTVFPANLSTAGVVTVTTCGLSGASAFGSISNSAAAKRTFCAASKVKTVLPATLSTAGFSLETVTSEGLPGASKMLPCLPAAATSTAQSSADCRGSAM